MLALGLRQLLALVCPVCDRPMLPDSDAPITAALLGVSNWYRVCPRCFREVDAQTECDPEHRRRVRVWLFENKNIVMRTP